MPNTKYDKYFSVKNMNLVIALYFDSPYTKIVMRKIAVLILALFFFSYKIPFAFAAVASQSGTTNITVTIAGNVLSLSGYIAPFASIVLTVDNTVITSTTADAAGNFSFSNVTVPKATSTVCLSAVDYKKLGTSKACITVTPVNGIITKTNVFLPPTLGVQRLDVNVGDNALLFGYGMPGATITVHLNGATGCTITAESSGYYTCTIKIQKAGTNELYADAVLNGKASEQQLDKVLIKGIAITKPTVSPAPTVAPSLPGLTLFQIPWWIWLLLVLIGIILIIILLRKYRPGALPTVATPSIRLNHMFDFLFKSRKLHHWWMKGVGY